MQRIRLFFQEILRFFLIFLIVFVWMRYFLKLWQAVLLTTLISVAVYFVIFLLNNHKKRRVGLKVKEKEEAENMFLSLSCKGNCIDFFEKLSKKKHENVIKHSNYLVIKYSEQVKTILYADISFQGLNTARFMEIYNKVKKEKANKIVICCYEICDKNLSNFVQNFQEKFIILDQYTTYQQLYKYYDCYPEITVKYKNESKLSMKELLAFSFNKKRTKGYLFSAIVLIISGLFVRTTLYYCISASILVVFAIISQFNPYYNLKTETEIL